MKLPDTCVWIEALVDSPTGRRYRVLFEAPDQLVVPTLVQYELRRWTLRELGEDAADRIVAMTHASRVVALDESTALRAAELAGRQGLATMDALTSGTESATPLFGSWLPGIMIHQRTRPTPPMPLK